MVELGRLPPHTYIFAVILLIALHAAVLLGMGQVPWCECGYIKFWHGVTYSSENSQHITDWYTFSHVIHGIGFYALFWLAGAFLRRRGIAVPAGFFFIAALALESGWELFENTDFIINRYREVTISLDYYGDSVINSVGDVLATALGFLIAWRLPIWASATLIVAMEVFVGYWIRDNLLLNIIMLIYPLDVILEWQGSG